MTPGQLITFPMPIGKYKAVFISQVPIEYLRNLSKDKAIVAKYPQIKEYVDYLERKALCDEFEQTLLPPKFKCTKITYATEAIAKAELARIKQREQKHKKPYRAYECPDCGGWHLTSRDDFNWIKKQTI